MHLFTRTTPQVSVVAATEVEVLVLHRHDFQVPAIVARDFLLSKVALEVQGCSCAKIGSCANINE